jgi:hypothetical protein
VVFRLRAPRAASAAFAPEQFKQGPMPSRINLKRKMTRIPDRFSVTYPIMRAGRPMARMKAPESPPTLALMGPLTLNRPGTGAKVPQVARSGRAFLSAIPSPRHAGRASGVRGCSWQLAKPPGLEPLRLGESTRLCIAKGADRVRVPAGEVVPVVIGADDPAAQLRMEEQVFGAVCQGFGDGPRSYSWFNPLPRVALRRKEPWGLRMEKAGYLSVLPRRTASTTRTPPARRNRSRPSGPIRPQGG